MKAIIQVAKRGSAVRAARAKLASERGSQADFLLSFESAKSLFSALSPVRLELLELLRGLGACSVYALAKEADRNYSNVHSDIAKLEELGLVTRTTDGQVQVLFESVEIHMPFAKAA
jgi:predicted transcriptional regulator